MSEPSGHGSWELRTDPPSLLEAAAAVVYRTALFGIALGGLVVECMRRRRG